MEARVSGQQRTDSGDFDGRGGTIDRLLCKITTVISIAALFCEENLA